MKVPVGVPFHFRVWNHSCMVILRIGQDSPIVAKHKARNQSHRIGIMVSTRTRVENYVRLDPLLLKIAIHGLPKCFCSSLVVLLRSFIFPSLQCLRGFSKEPGFCE